MAQSRADDLLKSPEANRDTELFGTEIGVADAMRYATVAQIAWFDSWCSALPVVWSAKFAHL